jgi:hypothetical protein
VGVLAPVLALSTLGSAGFGALLFLLLLLLFCGAVLVRFNCSFCFALGFSVFVMSFSMSFSRITDQSFAIDISRNTFVVRCMNQRYVNLFLLLYNQLVCLIVCFCIQWAAAPEFVEVAVDEEYERKNAYDDWEIIQFHERPELRAALKVPDDFQIDPKILQPNYTPHESNNSAATENFERSNNSFSRPPSNQVSRPTSATASRTISMADRYSSINSVQSIKSSYSGVSVDAASVARTESVLSQVTLPGSVDETHESQLSAAREHTEIEPPKLTGAALRAALRQQEQMRDKVSLTCCCVWCTFEIYISSLVLCCVSGIAIRNGTTGTSERSRGTFINDQVYLFMFYITMLLFSQEKARQQAALDALKPKVVPKEVEEEEPVDDFEARLAEVCLIC